MQPGLAVAPAGPAVVAVPAVAPGGPAVVVEQREIAVVGRAAIQPETAGRRALPAPRSFASRSRQGRRQSVRARGSAASRPVRDLRLDRPLQRAAAIGA